MAAKVRIALPHPTAARFGEQIASVDSRAELVPIYGADPRDPPLEDVEVLLHAFWFDLTPVSKIVPLLPSLRWVHSTGAGVDDLVTPDLRDRQILVTNVAGAYAPAMAEYILAAMVLVARPWQRWIRARDERNWLDRVDAAGITLRGKRVGIIGFGSVGRHLAPACKALGMEVWATRRTATLDATLPIDRLVAADDLHTLLEASDFVVVAASLNSSTRQLMDADAFAVMRPGAFFINVTRGEIVDQAALENALRTGRIGGAVLDVTDPEPPRPDDRLWTAPNLWITPHVSGDTPEGWRRGIDLFCTNLRLYLDRKPERMGNLIDVAEYL